MTLILMSIIPLLVAGQVIWLGMLENDELRKIGENQAETEIEIPALRGSILDSEGRVLAGDMMRDVVVLDPTVTGFASEAMRHYRVLSKATGLTVDMIDRRVRNRDSRKYLVLSRSVTLDEEARTAIQAIPGASVRKEFSRQYNYAASAPHVRGYVDVDMNGLEGIEKQYNDVLSGTPGLQTARRDRRGVRKMFPGGKAVEPQHGESLRLTIDIRRQTIMEEELAAGVMATGAKWGVAIALDPFTGAIQGMANMPTYDINQPGTVPVAFRKNSAIVNRLEPGSTFKLVTAITAIETGAVSMSDTFDTGNGYARIAGWPVRDTHGHGRIPFAEVISLSSNIGFAQLSERLEKGAFYQYARALGFGQSLGIDLPGEVSGTLRKTTSWSRSTLSSMSRGYGVDATPLQILTAYSALANGGVLVRPYVVSERMDFMGKTIWRAGPDSIRRAFSRKTAATLLPAFEEVVNSGTAETAQIKGIRVAGKTGTAKKVQNGRYTSGKYRASFVGFFPAENPKVAMIVVMDEPRSSIYGGYTAAPVFQRIAERWLATFPDIRRKEPLAETPVPDAIQLSQNATAAIPDVTRLPYAMAERKLSILDLHVTVEGTPGRADSIVMQSPESGTKVRRKTKVRIVAAAPEAVLSSVPVENGGEVHGVLTEKGIPDVIGMGARDATYILAAQGIRVRIEGSGRVVSQFPAAGVVRATVSAEEVSLRLR